MAKAPARSRIACALAVALMLVGCAAPSSAPPAAAPSAPTSAPAQAAPATQAPVTATKPAAAPTATAQLTPQAQAPAAAATGASATAGRSATVAPAAGLQKITVGYASVSASESPLYLAKDEGFFEQNGLDADLQFIPGGSSPTAALLSGQIQVLRISVEALQAALSGADLVYVAAPISSSLFSLYVDSSIHGADDLRGKQVGVTGIGTATYTAARMAVRSLGLDPDKDVTMTSINNVPAILAALKSGAIHAGVLSMPTILQAQQEGLSELVDVAKLGVPFPASWDAMSREYVNAHPDIARAYVKSMVQAIAFETKHPAETEAAIAKYSKVSDPTVLEASYTRIVPYLRKAPMPDVKAVQNALDELAPRLPQAKDADPAHFVDTRFVQELQDSGFIDKVNSQP